VHEARDGDGLLDDGVAAVAVLGLDQQQGGVGEPPRGSGRRQQLPWGRQAMTSAPISRRRRQISRVHREAGGQSLSSGRQEHP
jgi:hypothetical protein